MKQIYLWKWLGLGAAGLLLGVLVIASKIAPSKVAAATEPTASAPIKDEETPDHEDVTLPSGKAVNVDAVLQELKDAEAKKHPVAVHEGAQPGSPEQIQQQEIEARLEYVRALNAASMGQPRSDAPESSQKSFVIMFDDDGAAASPSKTVDPPTPTLPVDPQHSKADFSIPIGETNDQGTVARYPIYQGTAIPALLVDDVDSGIPGPVKCLTTETLTSADGQKVLIIKGSEAIGHTESVEGAGQHRLGIIFDYIRTPGNFEIHLSDLPSQGEDGENGIKGHVNNHFIRVFGTAMAIGLIGSGSTIGASSPLTGGGVDQLRYGFSNGMSEGAMQVLGRNAFIEPTITLKGNKTHLQIVVIGKDLALPALEDQRVKKSL